MADHRAGCPHGCNFWVWPDSEGLDSLRQHRELHDQGLVEQEPGPDRTGAGLSWKVVEP